MSDQLFLSVLTTLLNHPAFLEGLQEGIVTFEAGMFEEVLEKAWTEDDIIEFVDNEVSKAVYQQMQRAWRALGWSILPYLTYRALPSAIWL